MLNIQIMQSVIHQHSAGGPVLLHFNLVPGGGRIISRPSQTDWARGITRMYLGLAEDVRILPCIRQIPKMPIFLRADLNLLQNFRPDIQMVAFIRSHPP
jgi:hypothetical protein